MTASYPASDNAPGRPVRSRDRLIAIASSTGGTEALEKILTKLPADFPPILVVQHMPPVFTKSFAERLHDLCELRVKEGQHGEPIITGTVYIAPGGYHIRVVERQGDLTLSAMKGEKVHGVIPAADVLFQSVAALRNPNAIGVALTGMGNDGAAGLLAMKQQGAVNIGQSERTCVVYGMPRAAQEAGALHLQLDLNDIAPKLIALARAAVL